METIFLLLTGVFAGFVGALFGLGGGIVIVPVLTLIFGMPVVEAIGTSLVSIVAVSSIAAIDYIKSGRADIDLGLSLSIAASVGAVTGALLTGIIDDKLIFMLFSLILFFAAINMLKPRRIVRPGNIQQFPSNYFLGYLFSYFAGNVSGLLGVGGGIVQVPVMRLIMRMPLKIATATSSYMISIKVGPAAIMYLLKGEVDPQRACAIIIGTFVGSRMGAAASEKITAMALRLLFVLIMLYTAYKMFVRGL